MFDNDPLVSNPWLVRACRQWGRWPVMGLKMYEFVQIMESEMPVFSRIFRHFTLPLGYSIQSIA